MRPFRQEKRRLPKSITRLEKKRNYAKKIWHSPPRSGYLGTPLPLPRVCTGEGAYRGTGVRAYRRTLTSQPNVFGLIGYQICLAMVIRWRASARAPL